MDVQSSPFKLRALLQQLRPHFLEVLGTLDFRNCNAAHEILKHMKLLMDLNKPVILERIKPLRMVAPAGCRGSRQERMPTKQDKQRKQQKQSLKKKSMESGSSTTALSSNNKGTLMVGGSVSDWNFITYVEDKEDKERKQHKKSLKRKSMESGSTKSALSLNKKGTLTVGGSVSDWNFITYADSKPLYYGVKKESYRSSHNK